MYVQPYQNGVQFAEGFARQLGVPCGGITVHERRNLAEQVAASNAMYRQFGLPLTIDLGELSFSCGSGGQAVSGYSLAGSVVYNMDAVYNVGAGGIWYVEYLMAYLASPGREAEAASVLERMTRSFTVNPAWYAAQTHATLQTARDNLKTSKEIMGMIEDVFQHRRVSVGRMYDRHLGVVATTRVMRDPLTGKEYTIRGNHEYVWIDQQGRTVYTKTADNPDLRYYRALVGD